MHVSFPFLLLVSFFSSSPSFRFLHACMQARKKLALRDERIKQLECNTRMLAANMRTQAERHVSEMAKVGRSGTGGLFLSLP
jgi:hypothetical protein